MEFDLGLLAGLIAGTYSSLFIASQIWYMLESKVVGKPKRKKCIKWWNWTIRSGNNKSQI